MSRQSSESLTVVPLGVQARLEPPADLTPDQADRWRAIVATKPADWFAEDSAPLLKEYVRAADMCDRLHWQVEASMAALDTGEPSFLKTLLGMRDKESRRLTTLGTKLRLTQQSRYTPDKASVHDRKAGNARPWNK